MGALALAAALGACRTAAPSGRNATVPRADSGRVGVMAVDTGVRSTGDSAKDGPAGTATRAIVDPSTAVRFEIVAVGDTTFDFVAADASWLRARMRGIAVDPRRRDVLIARFQVLGMRGDTASALVTGQTARVTTDHMALVSRPPEPPRIISRVEHRRFWAGVLAGGLFGLIAGLLIGI